MTLTNSYAHAIMKQKKTKTDYLRGLSVFVFVVFVYIHYIRDPVDRCDDKVFAP